MEPKKKPLEVVNHLREIIGVWRGICPCSLCREKDQDRIRKARDFLCSVTIEPESASPPAPVPDVLDQTVTLLTTGDRVTVRQLLWYHKSQFDLLGYRGSKIGEMRAEIKRLEGQLAAQARTIGDYQKQADPELKWLRQEVERLTKLSVDQYAANESLRQECVRLHGDLALSRASDSYYGQNNGLIRVEVTHKNDGLQQEIEWLKRRIDYSR